MENKNLNLHQKLLKIANIAGVLQRTKKGYGYKYVPEEDIQAKVTAGMQKYGVMLYQSIDKGTLKITPYTYVRFDATQKKEVTCYEIIVSADLTYTWVNVDNPKEKIENSWAIVGQMSDAAQAFGAAETYGNRYFLMKSLQLATTESDPDNYRSKQKEAEDEIEKEEKEKLQLLIKSLVKEGERLIVLGVDKTLIGDIVAKHNNGDRNPSTIKFGEVCEKIMSEFSEIKPGKNGKKTSEKENV